MQTFNHFSEIAAATEQNIVGVLPYTTGSTTNAVEPGNKVAELLETTVRDAVQFKGLAVICPEYTPVATFEMAGDVLRLKQVTLVDASQLGCRIGLSFRQ